MTVVSTAVGAGFSVAPLVHALTVPSPAGLSGTLPTPITQTSDITDLATGITQWIFWILIAFSIVMFLVGGYRYVTSGGEPEKVGSANKTLLFAAIAVAVALIAMGMPLLVASFLGL